MNTICDGDLHYLKPGKRIVLKTYKGSTAAPENLSAQENYWRLIGCKAVVASTNNSDQVLITFEANLLSLGLVNHNELPNALWVLISDLKFVCR